VDAIPEPGIEATTKVGMAKSEEKHMFAVSVMKLFIRNDGGGHKTSCKLMKMRGASVGY
jgi:hypothetical protein